MKLYQQIISFAVAMCLFTVSCKKNKNDGQKNSIVGTWVKRQSAFDQNNNNVMDADEIKGAYYYNFNFTMMFNNDQTGMSSFVYQDSAGLATENTTFTWSLANNDKDIQIHETGQRTSQYNMHIERSSATELVIKYVWPTTGQSLTSWEIYEKK